MALGERFIVFNNKTVGFPYTDCLFIVDFTWWVDYEAIIKDWLNTNIGADNYKLDGIVLQFKEEQSLTLFLLRWN